MEAQEVTSEQADNERSKGVSFHEIHQTTPPPPADPYKEHTMWGVMPPCILQTHTHTLTHKNNNNSNFLFTGWKGS